jgi:hypothetical protein
VRRAVRVRRSGRARRRRSAERAARGLNTPSEAVRHVGGSRGRRWRRARAGSAGSHMCIGCGRNRAWICTSNPFTVNPRRKLNRSVFK